MSKIRKFAAIDGAGVISVEEGPIPEPGPGEAQGVVHCLLPRR